MILNDRSGPEASPADARLSGAAGLIKSAHRAFASRRALAVVTCAVAAASASAR